LPWPIADGRDRSGDHASYGSGLRRLAVPAPGDHGRSAGILRFAALEHAAGDFTTLGKNSDTLNPHEQPFTGMLYRHSRLASGRTGCSLSSSRWTGLLSLVTVSVVLADGHCRVVVTGA